MKWIKRRWGWFITLLVFLLCLCVLISICCGHYSISVGSTFRILLCALLGKKSIWATMDSTVIFGLRLPRIIGAILVGASLSIAGATYQSIFQNPLISPDILGASSGACVGAAFGILMHYSKVTVTLISFSLGIITVVIAALIPKLLRASSNVFLVLSGIIVGGIMDSVMGIIKYIADPQSELPQITYWTMGALDSVSYGELLVSFFPILVCCILLFRMSWWVDILSFGDSDAQLVGMDIKKVKVLSLVTATLLTSLAVCLCGSVGWIGLIIPHFSRMLVGGENRRVFPAAVILGAIFLVIVDTAARTIASVEVPLGVITGFVGAPVYGWLLFIHNKGRNKRVA